MSCRRKCAHHDLCPSCLWSLLSDLQADIAAVLVAATGHTDRLVRIEKEMIIMGAREDQAYNQLNQTIQTVKDGWASLIAERDALKDALEQADADKAAAVQAALDADSDVDASKVEAADAALNELVANPPAEPTDGDLPPAA